MALRGLEGRFYSCWMRRFLPRTRPHRLDDLQGAGVGWTRTGGGTAAAASAGTAV